MLTSVPLSRPLVLSRECQSADGSAIFGILSINHQKSVDYCLNWTQRFWHLHLWVAIPSSWDWVSYFSLTTAGYFIKYLDQVNINNAFVSGMWVWLENTSKTSIHSLRPNRKEDLGLYGNELNYMQACWTVGYVIGEIPSNLLLTRIRPRYWIPAMEVCLVFLDQRDPILKSPSCCGQCLRSRSRDATRLHSSMFCDSSSVCFSW